jgi:hypothetical protein
MQDIAWSVLCSSASSSRSPTELVAAGVDVKTAQAVLGHSDSWVTLDFYAQVVTEQHKAAVNATAARSSIPPRGADAGCRRPKPARATVPKRGERACDQALSVESGGRDLNSRPLRPERAASPPTRQHACHRALVGVLYHLCCGPHVGRMWESLWTRLEVLSVRGPRTGSHLACIKVS